MTSLAPVVEQERERQQDDEDQQPGPMSTQHGHVSRVPISPRGRNTRISTSIRNGSSAPTRGSVTLRTSANGVLDVTTKPNLAKRSASDTSNTTAKVWINPNKIGPMVNAIAGSVTW